MADGQVVFEITGDSKPIQKSLSETTRAIQNESKKWDDTVDDSSGKISDSLIGAFKAVTASAAFIKVGQMLLQLGGESIQLASDLEEVQNVVDTTFGAAGAEKVNKWAEEARKKFGLTELQAKQYASTMGAIFKTNGIADDEIVKMSTDIAGLAADMASFYNMDFDTAFNKIQSGLAGMPQPLRDIGVEMSETAVSAYAAANGFETAFSEMSQADKYLVRYQYLMSQTSLAQGDFAKTADDFANSQRRMTTGFDTLKSKLGEALLPIATTLSNAVNDLLDMLLYEPPETAFDVAEQSISDAAGAATQAQGILGYMEKLQEEYGDSAEGAKRWADALEELKKVLPDVNQFIDEESGKLKITNDELRAYIENSKQAAIEDAKKAALSSLTEQYMQAGKDYYTAEINRDMSVEKANQARKDLIDYVASHAGQENFTGAGMSIDQLKTAAQATANEFGESQETIAELCRIFDESTAEAEAYNAQMQTLESTMTSLKADLDIASAALERLASAAGSAAGGLPASVYMNSGQYYNALYGGKINGSHASGLDYVPFDGYIAELHQGERILTAAEASLSRSYGFSGSYGPDVLNAILASNLSGLKAGGNVYLDGRTVGQVISAMQGQSYRSLKRSGWQQ